MVENVVKTAENDSNKHFLISYISPDWKGFNGIFIGKICLSDSGKQKAVFVKQ